jgi:hypothetical protein
VTVSAGVSTATIQGKDMTLKELKGKYARLSDEIDDLAAAGGRNEARLARLLGDLDQVHQQLAELRRRTFGAPTLRDVVSMASAAQVLPLRGNLPAAPAQRLAKASMRALAAG